MVRKFTSTLTPHSLGRWWLSLADSAAKVHERLDGYLVAMGDPEPVDTHLALGALLYAFSRPSVFQGSMEASNDAVECLLGLVDTIVVVDLGQKTRYARSLILWLRMQSCGAVLSTCRALTKSLSDSLCQGAADKAAVLEDFSSSHSSLDESRSISPSRHLSKSTQGKRRSSPLEIPVDYPLPFMIDGCDHRELWRKTFRSWRQNVTGNEVEDGGSPLRGTAHSATEDKHSDSQPDNMNYEVHRLCTFTGWPHMSYRWAIPAKLAQAGFYFLPGPGDSGGVAVADRTICYECGLELVSWSGSDVPWVEHRRLSPDCRLVKGEATDNVPLSAGLADRLAERLDKMDGRATPTKLLQTAAARGISPMQSEANPRGQESIPVETPKAKPTRAAPEQRQFSEPGRAEFVSPVGQPPEILAGSFGKSLNMTESMGYKSPSRFIEAMELNDTVNEIFSRERDHELLSKRNVSSTLISGPRQQHSQGYVIGVDNSLHDKRESPISVFRSKTGRSQNTAQIEQDSMLQNGSPPLLASKASDPPPLVHQGSGSSQGGVVQTIASSHFDQPALPTEGTHKQSGTGLRSSLVHKLRGHYCNQGASEENTLISKVVDIVEAMGSRGAASEIEVDAHFRLIATGIQSIYSQNRDLQREVQSMNRQIVAERQLKEKAEKKCLEVSRDVDSFRNVNDDTSRLVDMYSGRLQESEASKEILRVEVNALKDINAELEARLQEEEARSSSFKVKAENLEREMESTLRKRSEIERSHNQAEVAALSSKIAELTELVSATNDMKENFVLAEKELSALKEAEKAKAKMNEEISKHLERVSELERLVRGLEEKNSQLETERDTLQKRVQNYAERMQEMATEQNVGKGTVLKEEVARLQRVSEEARAEVQAVKEEKEIVHRRLSEVEEKSIPSLEEEVRSLQQENAKLRGDIMKWKNDYTNNRLVNRANRLVVDKKKCGLVIAQLREFAPLIGELKDYLTGSFRDLYGDFQTFSQEVGLIAELNDHEKSSLRMAYSEEVTVRKLLFNKLQELQGNIRVFCRVRPRLMSEIRKGAVDIVEYPENDTQHVVVRDKNNVRKMFEFDYVFPGNASQDTVFSETKPLITSCLDGYNVCIFAYGQTGSGKTHTMFGPVQDPGVAFKTIHELFDRIEQRRHGESTEVYCSMMEIYNEQIRDLLVHDSACFKKSDIYNDAFRGMCVKDVSVFRVYSAAEIDALLVRGHENRAVGVTNVHEHSSRSHMLLSIICRTENLTSGEVCLGKLTLVDLAGSERVSKTEVTGDRLNEAKYINKSLNSLGDVMAALSAGEAYIPFRNSALVYLLQDSLGGDSKVLMIANISTSNLDAQESLCSLNFALRAKTVALGPARKRVVSTPRLTSLAQSQNQNQNDYADRSMISGRADSYHPSPSPSETPGGYASRSGYGYSSMLNSTNSSDMF